MAGAVTTPDPKPFVLIVEDNEDGREALRLLLLLHGCAVEAAADGIEGVRKGMERQPRVAIIDIGLPGMSGLEVAWQLRTMYRNEILLIAHTAQATPRDHERAREAGFDLLLAKGCEPRELLDLLKIGANLPIQPAA